MRQLLNKQRRKWWIYKFKLFNELCYDDWTNKLKLIDELQCE